MYRTLICCAAVLTGCGADALTAGQRALEQGDLGEAVTRLRQAYDERSGAADVAETYQKALSAYHEQLRRSNVSAEICDGAVEGLSKISGFAEGTKAVDGEAEVLGQALLCAARHRARERNPDAAVKVVVQGIKRLPGFDPGSPVLAKALVEPALRQARAGQVAEATALAQVIFSAGDHGLALAIVDLLEASGVGAADIYPVLEDRANQAKTSDSASGLAAGFAAYRGHAAEAARWFDEIVERASKDGSSQAKALKSYAKLRAEEAARLAEFRSGACSSAGAAVTTLASKIGNIPALAAESAGDSALIAWIEGTKAPEQRLKVLRIPKNGVPADPVTVAESMPAAAKNEAGGVIAAYAPKNREASLALARCGGVVELAARGAPECSWVRATFSDEGQLTSKLTPVGPLGPNGHMPAEDVWWNIGCSNDKLVHLWLADTQLMRLAWFSAGVTELDPVNIRLPGFSPWFVATSAEDGGTRLVWADIMGEGLSQILGVVIPESQEVPVGEDGMNVAGQPVVESVEGRIEHLRLTPVGERLALTFHPRGSDIMVRWLDRAGKLLGASAPVTRLRPDAQKVRFDAAAVGDRLGVAWTEGLTEEWSTLYFQSVGVDGNNPSRPQRLGGLVRPDTSPIVVALGDRFAVAWIDRIEEQGESIRLAAVDCGQLSSP